MPVASDDRNVLQVEISDIQQHNVEGLGSRHPVTFDDSGKRVGLSSRIVKHPEIMVAKANGDWTLRETFAQIFQSLPGLLCAREVARYNERIRPMTRDPFSEHR